MSSKRVAGGITLKEEFEVILISSDSEDDETTESFHSATTYPSETTIKNEAELIVIPPGFEGDASADAYNDESVGAEGERHENSESFCNNGDSDWTKGLLEIADLIEKGSSNFTSKALPQRASVQNCHTADQIPGSSTVINYVGGNYQTGGNNLGGEAGCYTFLPSVKPAHKNPNANTTSLMKERWEEFDKVFAKKQELERLADEDKQTIFKLKADLKKAHEEIGVLKKNVHASEKMVFTQQNEISTLRATLKATKTENSKFKAKHGRAKQKLGTVFGMFKDVIKNVTSIGLELSGDEGHTENLDSVEQSGAEQNIRPSENNVEETVAAENPHDNQTTEAEMSGSEEPEQIDENIVDEEDETGNEDVDEAAEESPTAVHGVDHSKKEQGFFCLCGKSFVSFRSLVHHERYYYSNAFKSNTSHTSRKAGHSIDYSKGEGFFCKCGSELSSKSNLAYHINYYTREKKFVCHICNYRCAYGSILRTHYKTKHKIVPIGMSGWAFSCRICQERFPSYAQMFRHQKLKHGQRNGKRFQSQVRAPSSPETTMGESNVRNIDNEGYTSPGRVLDRKIKPPDRYAPADIRHRGGRKRGRGRGAGGIRAARYYSNQVILQQSVASTSSYSTSSHQESEDATSSTQEDELDESSFNQQYDIHGVDYSKNDFYCLCGKKLVSEAAVVRHVRLKSNPGIFKCNYCPKRFARHDYLKYHAVKAHGVNMTGTWACGLCGQKYFSSQQLLRHRKFAHKVGRRGRGRPRKAI